jgi:hypothetical protein
MAPSLTWIFPKGGLSANLSSLPGQPNLNRYGGDDGTSRAIRGEVGPCGLKVTKESTSTSRCLKRRGYGNTQGAGATPVPVLIRIPGVIKIRPKEEAQAALRDADPKLHTTM